MILTVLPAADGHGRLRERARVPAAQQWRLEDLYPSDQAWEQAKSELAGRLDEILQYKGRLTESAGPLLACLTLNSEISRVFGRLHSYATMKSDEDTRNATYLAMKQEIKQLITEYHARASFLEPEIVTLDKETVEKFVAAEPALKVYRMYLFDVLRGKPHTLSKEEEKLLARTLYLDALKPPGDTFTALYGDILKEYYGHDRGICRIDDLYTVEWVCVPHFYYRFYVYQYSTSFTAATALAEEARAGKGDAARRYLDFISAGGSDYPIETLKRAGIDMTTPGPFQETMAAMNRTMDEIETILARREGR